MRKQLFKISAVLLSCMLLIGCNMKRPDTNTEAKDKIEELKELAIGEIGKELSFEMSEAIQVEAEVRIPEGMEDYTMNELELSRYLWENQETELEKLLELCNADGKGEAEKVVKDADGELEDRKNINLIEIDSEDGRYFQIRDHRLLVSRDTTQIMEHQYGEFTEEGRKKGAAYESEVAGYVKAIEEAYEITFSDEYTYSGIETIYYVGNLRQAHNNIRFLQDSYFGPCEFRFTADGIESLELHDLFVIKNEGKENDIISIGEVLEIHEKEHYRVKETITKIELVYFPVYVGNGENLDFVAKPAWYIESEDSVGTKYQVVYDAEIGEKLMDIKN